VRRCGKRSKYGTKIRTKKIRRRAMGYTKNAVAFMKIGAEIDEMGAGDELRPKMEGDESENAADEGPDDGREGETMIGAYELGGDEDDGDEGGGTVNESAGDELKPNMEGDEGPDDGREGAIMVGAYELCGDEDGGEIDERLKTSQIKVEGAVRRVEMGAESEGLLRRSLKRDATGGATESSSSIVMTVERCVEGSGVKRSCSEGCGGLGSESAGTRGKSRASGMTGDDFGDFGAIGGCASAGGASGVRLGVGDDR
jgi:hypothetical protein